MPYAEAATTNELFVRLNSRLKLESADTAGRDPEALAAALNEAARLVGDELTRGGHRDLLSSATRTVAAGAASVALPDGSLAAEPRVKRLLEVSWQAATTAPPTPLRIADLREAVEEPALTAADSYALALENLTLRWLSYTGAPAAGTLTLRYLAALPLVSKDTRTATPFGALAPELTDVILDLATARLLPAAHAAAERYEARGQARLADQVALAQRCVHTEGRHIRRTY